jgi:hypothetical protein
MILSDKVVWTSGTGIINTREFSTVSISGPDKYWVFSRGLNHPKINKVMEKPTAFFRDVSDESSVLGFLCSGRVYDRIFLLFRNLSIFSNTFFGKVQPKCHAKRHLTLFTLLGTKIYHTVSPSLMFPYECHCFPIFSNRHIFSKYILYYLNSLLSLTNLFREISRRCILQRRVI